MREMEGRWKRGPVEFRTNFGHLVLRSTLLLRFVGVFPSSAIQKMLTDYIGYFGNRRNAKYIANIFRHSAQII